jgi:hypothetical protein
MGSRGPLYQGLDAIGERSVAYYLGYLGSTSEL